MCLGQDWQAMVGVGALGAMGGGGAAPVTRTTAGSPGRGGGTGEQVVLCLELE